MLIIALLAAMGLAPFAAPSTNPAPEPEAIMCCSVPKPGVYGSCTPLPTSGFCESGKVPHQCSDVETCNDDGSACWVECKPLSGGTT